MLLILHVYQVLFSTDLSAHAASQLLQMQWTVDVVTIRRLSHLELGVVGAC